MGGTTSSCFYRSQKSMRKTRISPSIHIPETHHGQDVGLRRPPENMIAGPSVTRPPENMIAAPSVTRPPEIVMAVPNVTMQPENAIDVPSLTSTSENTIAVPSVTRPPESTIAVPGVTTSPENTIAVPGVTTPPENAIAVPNVTSTSENMMVMASLRKPPENTIVVPPGIYPAATFTYNELAIATDNFNENNFLGEGGFGRVYKGTLNTGKAIAVKKLDRRGCQGDKEFQNEVLVLSLVQHPNLVRLIGYCGDIAQPYIVYEFVPLGSLDNHLFEHNPHNEVLDWNTRVKIALGAAEGLEFLHTNPIPIIYRDLKAANVLLDEEYNAKLSDFGISRFAPLGEERHVLTRVLGTKGYLDPEYLKSGRLSMKSDIHAFGILLLELITGRKAFDKTKPSHEEFIAIWALALMRHHSNYVKLADPMLERQFPRLALIGICMVAFECINYDPKLRPSITQVVAALKVAEKIQHDPRNRNQVEESTSSMNIEEIAKRNLKDMLGFDVDESFGGSGMPDGKRVAAEDKKPVIGKGKEKVDA